MNEFVQATLTCIHAFIYGRCCNVGFSFAPILRPPPRPHVLPRCIPSSPHPSATLICYTVGRLPSNTQEIFCIDCAPLTDSRVALLAGPCRCDTGGMPSAASVHFAGHTTTAVLQPPTFWPVPSLSFTATLHIDRRTQLPCQLAPSPTHPPYIATAAFNSHAPHKNAMSNPPLFIHVSFVDLVFRIKAGAERRSPRVQQTSLRVAQHCFGYAHACTRPAAGTAAKCTASFALRPSMRLVYASSGCN